MHCWEQRACDDEMSSVCPFAVASFDKVCPAKCYFTNCKLPQRTLTSSFELILDLSVDRSVAIKENCLNCEYFLKNAPRMEENQNPDHA